MNFKIVFPNAHVVEPTNFVMNREGGGARYIFFHFVNPVEITLEGKNVITNPGAVILYSPNYPQIFHPIDVRLNHDYVDFETLNPDFFKDIEFPLNTIIYPRMSKTINSTIREINSILKREETGFALEMDAKFTMLLLDISKSINIKKSHKNFNLKGQLQKNFEEARLSLYTNPTHTNVSTLAESLGFSSSYFNKKYKELFHISPIDDISKARIEYTKNQLLQNQNIDTIVEALGFANNEYFYRWFKKMTGKTPKEFINE